jgi:hypothetical protein
MPNQLSESKKRITYSEFADVYAELKKLADSSGIVVSQIVRNATSDFLKKKQQGKWKAAPYSKAINARSAKLKRVSYAEWRECDESMNLVAKQDRLDKSDLLRQAVHTYLAARKK